MSDSLLQLVQLAEIHLLGHLPKKKEPQEKKGAVLKEPPAQPKVEEPPPPKNTPVVEKETLSLKPTRQKEEDPLASMRELLGRVAKEVKLIDAFPEKKTWDAIILFDQEKEEEKKLLFSLEEALRKKTFAVSAKLSHDGICEESRGYILEKPLYEKHQASLKEKQVFVIESLAYLVENPSERKHLWSRLLEFLEKSRP